MTSRLSSMGRGDLGLPTRRKTVVGDFSSNTGKSRIPGPSTSSSSLGVRQSLIGKGSRVSSAGLPSSRRSSRSSVYGQGPPGVKKDPRPLSDKAYQQACIKKLRNFLIEEQYPRDVKPKCLQSPSTKEYIFILNFILERLDPSLVIAGFKIDEEIPYLLKLLRYPFSISKNHLLSVGSPHSWPIMLGLLMWILNGVQQDLSSQLMFPKQGDFDEDNMEEKCFEFTNELYRVFLLQGTDSEEYNHLLSVRESTQKTVCEQSEQALQEEIKLMEALEQICQELSMSSIDTLRQKLADIKSTRDNMVLYLNSELGPAIETANADQNELQKQIATLEGQTEMTKEKITELVEQIRTQPMSAREAQDLRQKIKEKHDTRLTLKQRVEEARQGVFDLQRRHSNIVSRVDKECKEVNDSLRRLSVMVPDGQCIPILDYNTSKRADPSVLHQLMHQAKSIKASVHQLNERTAQELADIESRKINAESVFSSLQNELTMTQIEVENGEHEIAREKKLLEQLKKRREDEMKMLLSSKMSLENQIISYQETLRCDETERSLEAMMKRFNEEYKRIVSSIHQKSLSLQDVCVALSEHLEKQRTKQHNARTEYQKLLELFQQIRPPVVKAKYYPATLEK